MIKNTRNFEFKLYVVENDNNKGTLFMTINEGSEIMLSSVRRVSDEFSGNRLCWALPGFDYRVTYHEDLMALLDYAIKHTEVLISCYLSHISEVY